MILKANFDIPSSLMFQELNRLSVENRLKYNKAVLTYRVLDNLTSDYLTELLTPLSEIHLLNLRSLENGLLHIPLSRITRLLAQPQNYVMLYHKRSEFLILC